MYASRRLSHTISEKRELAGSQSLIELQPILRSLDCVAMSLSTSTNQRLLSQPLRAGPRSGGQGHCGRFLSQHSLGFNLQHRECGKRPNDLHSFIGHWPANTSLTLSWPDLMNEMKSFPFLSSLIYTGQQ